MTAVEQGQQPRSPTETYLSRLWAEALGLAAVGIDDDFFLLGGDSTSLLSLTTRIHAESGVKLPLHSVFETPTVREMALLLNAGDPAEPTGRCLVALSRVGSATPLFCIHGAGGNIPIFGPLSRALSPERPCYGLQAVGLSRKIEPDRSASAMADRYAAEIKLVWPFGHLIVGGYSMGGVIALEVARAARPEREVTCVLFDTDISDKEVRETHRSQALFFVARTLGLDPYEFMDGARTPGEEINELGTDVPRIGDERYEQALTALTEELVARGLLPVDGARADVERLTDMYAINSAVLRDHRIKSYDGHVVFVVTGTGDKSTEEVIGSMGWAGLLRSVTLVRAEGDHHTFLANHAARLAAQLRQVLPG
jgi:thioesterase domain-containing protein/acyl carrier protein